MAGDDSENIAGTPAKGKRKGGHKAKILSAAFVRTVTAPGFYADGEGLYLKVEATGAKRYVQRLLIRGKRRDIAIGPVSLKDLREAREDALENRKLLRKGTDPRAERARAKTMPTFGEFADAWVEDFVADRRSEKHKAFYRRAATTYCEPIRHILVSDLTANDIADMLRPMWKLGKDGRMESAARTRGIIERVWDAAKVKHRLTGENPARWKGNLKSILPPRVKLTRGHQAAAPYKALPGIIAALRADTSVAARALEFTTLHAIRTGEVIGDLSHDLPPLMWSEVDLKAGLVTVAAGRTKGQKRAHTFPLPPRSLEILHDMHKLRSKNLPTDPVFPGATDGKGLNPNAMRSVLKRLAPEASVHGMRSAFKDWCNNETEFAEEISEEISSRNVGSEVRRAYRRDVALAKHLTVLTAWSTYLMGGEVVPMAKGEAA